MNAHAAHHSPRCEPLTPAVSTLTLRAVRAALDAGREIMAIYAQDFTVEYKDDHSPLTNADRAAHQVLTTALQETHIPVLSEESECVPYETRRHWSSLWLVDPLDGTKEFVKKNGDFTVNIALIEAGRPIMGVVYAPAHQDLFVGVQGWGAYRATDAGVFQSMETLHTVFSSQWKKNGEKFQSMEKKSAHFPVNGKKEPAPGALQRLRLKPEDGAGDTAVRVVASRSHGTADTESFVQRLETAGRVVTRVSRGSALKLCMVAAGEAQVYPRLAPTMEWDTAAAQAVVECAGGKVVRYHDAMHAAYQARGPAALNDGEPLTYNRPNLLNPWFVVFNPYWSVS